MRILVTGSSGHVGAAVAERLARDHEVVGLDLLPGPCTTLEGSINDESLIRNLLRGMDAVVHCAALHAPHVGVRSEAEFLATNVDGTTTLLQAAARHGVRRFICTSTTSLYGHAMVPRGDRAVWVTEELTPEPRDIYDQTKLAAEGLCRRFSQAHGLTALCLRISRCFPESEEQIAIHRLHRGIDVRDVAEAHSAALESELSGFDVFNISALPPFREEETFELMHDARHLLLHRFPGIGAKFARHGWTLPRRIERVYVIDKAMERLRWRPRYNFDTVYLNASL